MQHPQDFQYDQIVSIKYIPALRLSRENGKYFINKIFCLLYIKNLGILGEIKY